MSEKDYPNERDCEHGHLRRSCPICAAEADYAALFASHNALAEAVRGLLGSLDNGEFKTTITHSVAAEMAEKVYRINRAEVDRLLLEES